MGMIINRLFPPVGSAGGPLLQFYKFVNDIIVNFAAKVQKKSDFCK